MAKNIQRETGTEIFVDTTSDRARPSSHFSAALHARSLADQRASGSAFAAAERRGKILGLNGRSLAVKKHMAVDDFASQLREKLPAGVLRRSFRGIARHLNNAGALTATGENFDPQAIKTI